MLLFLALPSENLSSGEFANQAASLFFVKLDNEKGQLNGFGIKLIIYRSNTYNWGVNLL